MSLLSIHESVIIIIITYLLKYESTIIDKKKITPRLLVQKGRYLVITQSQQTILIRTCLPFFSVPGLKHNTKEFFHVPKDESFYEKRQFRTCTRSWSIFHFSFLRLDLLKQNRNKKYKHKK